MNQPLFRKTNGKDLISFTIHLPVIGDFTFTKAQIFFILLVCSFIWRTWITPIQTTIENDADTLQVVAKRQLIVINKQDAFDITLVGMRTELNNIEFRHKIEDLKDSLGLNNSNINNLKKKSLIKSGGNK